MTQRVRNKEIKHLVNTINDLAVLFKDLSVLVVEQGTILDRIDYNIECAHKDVKQANVHLTATVKIEKSFRSKGVMGCLVISILVCLLLLVLKHT
jgi:syntaxin 16